jgi:hypothetical protein
MAEENSNRRKFDRLERGDEILIKRFSYPETGQFQKAKILDISGGGLQIESRSFFEEKAVLKIEMNFTGWQRFTPRFLKYFGEAADQPLVVLAEVIRCKQLIAGTKYEIATKFSGIDESHRLALIKFIRAEILSKKRSR